MLNILIVDDEKLIRAGIRKILDDALSPPVSFRDARNGREALDLLHQDSADIVITDIRMPVMDGIALMGELSHLPQAPLVIVLSGYDDFSYAKAAMREGAVSYILKPVDPAELVATVKDAALRCLDAGKSRIEALLSAILLDPARVHSPDFPRSAVPASFVCICAVPLIKAVFPSTSLRTLCDEEEGAYLFEERVDSSCVLLAAGVVEGFCERALLAGFSLGLSRVAQDLALLASFRDEAHTLLLGRLYGDEKSLWNRDEGQSVEFDSAEGERRIEHLLSAVELSGVADTSKRVGALQEYCAKGPEAVFRLSWVFHRFADDLFLRYSSFMTRDVYLHRKCLMLRHIQHASSVADWFGNLSDFCVYLSILIRSRTAEHPFVDEALSFIARNFTRDINMAVVANHVSVNYTWFSEKFKERMGINFNEYLKRLRLDEAKRLLCEGSWHVYEVARRCGFSDVKYFMKVFKEYTGSAPGQWRERMAREACQE